MTKSKEKALEAEKARLDRTYGFRTGGLGSDKVKLKSYSTGILSLDYALGTGGWPKGYLVEVFGPEDIGKSSAIGLSAIRGAQKEGALCGIIALEPNFDDAWAEKNGVDPNGVVIARPKNGEIAFNILYDWVTGDLLDLILFDSIGALLKGTEIEVDGKVAKPSQGGQSPLITWGVKRVVMPAYHNDKTVIFLNQVRDVMSSPYNSLDSPGGHALKHSCSQRIQLKPKNRYTATVDGVSGVTTGRELIAQIVRNKLSEGTGQRAIFDYHQKDTDENTVGVDLADDLIRTGKKTGVLQGNSYLRHHLFPQNKSGECQLHGRKAVAEWMKNNPKELDQIRDEILDVMLKREGSPQFEEPTDVEES